VCNWEESENKVVAENDGDKDRKVKDLEFDIPYVKKWKS